MIGGGVAKEREDNIESDMCVTVREIQGET